MLNLAAGGSPPPVVISGQPVVSKVRAGPHGLRWWGRPRQELEFLLSDV